MKRHTTLFIVMLVGIALALPSRAADPLHNIPLTWKPTSKTTAGAVDLTALGNARIRVIGLTDARKSLELIGENREKGGVLTVTTKDNVAGFVTQRLRDLLAGNGLNVVDNGETVSLSGEIRKFFVAETNTYQGEVVLMLTVSNPAGKALWTGIVSGASQRFGRSYKAENYHETLSDALIEAVNNLLRNPGFEKALRGR